MAKRQKPRVAEKRHLRPSELVSNPLGRSLADQIIDEISSDARAKADAARQGPLLDDGGQP